MVTPLAESQSKVWSGCYNLYGFVPAYDGKRSYCHEIHGKGLNNSLNTGSSVLNCDYAKVIDMILVSCNKSIAN